MTRSDQTVRDLFEALKQSSGELPIFEDVPALVLEAEKASESHLEMLPTNHQKAL